jgi:hypothetical protein
MNIKKIALSSSAVLLSGVSWYFFRVIFSSDNIFFGNGLNWILFALASALSFGFLFIIALAKDRADYLATSFLSTIWIILFLGFNGKTLLAAAALFVSLQIIQDFPEALARSLNVRYYITAYSKLAFVILVMLGVTSAYLKDHLDESLISKTISEQTSKYAWPYISKYIPYNSEQSVNEYLTTEFQGHGIANPNNQMVAESRNALSTELGFNLKGSERMSDIGKRFVSNRVTDLVDSVHLSKTNWYFIFFSLLILWPVGRLFYAMVAALIFHIFKAAGLVRIVEAEITVKKAVI